VRKVKEETDEAIAQEGAAASRFAGLGLPRFPASGIHPAELGPPQITGHQLRPRTCLAHSAGGGAPGGECMAREVGPRRATSRFWFSVPRSRCTTSARRSTREMEGTHRDRPRNRLPTHASTAKARRWLMATGAHHMDNALPSLEAMISARPPNATLSAARPLPRPAATPPIPARVRYVKAAESSKGIADPRSRACRSRSQAAAVARDIVGFMVRSEKFRRRSVSG